MHKKKIFFLSFFDLIETYIKFINRQVSWWSRENIAFKNFNSTFTFLNQSILALDFNKKKSANKQIIVSVNDSAYSVEIYISTR